MSQETEEWLNRNILVGCTEKRGNAWHYKQSAQGDEPNHYPGFIPVEDVKRRLFGWEAAELQTFMQLPDGRMVPMLNRKAIVPDDLFTPGIEDIGIDPLGIFKDGYKPHQYFERLIEGPAMLIDQSKGELGIGSAGLLRNRGVGFVSIEVPDCITTPEGVEFRPYLLNASSFDGTLSTTHKRVITNVVCDNTMEAGLGEAGQAYKIKHTRYSEMKLADAREALNLIFTAADEFAAEVATLCATKVTDRQWNKLLDVTVPLPEDEGRALTMAENKRAELVKLWSADPRVAPWTKTAFGVLQAFNTYGAHLSIVRGRGGKTPNRVERNIWGDIKGKTAEADAEVMTALAGVLAGD